MHGVTSINGKPVFGPPRPPRQNYLLSIHLEPNEITNPAVKRTLSCPATTTFYELHEAIQVAFGWSTTHTFDFKTIDPNAPREEDEDANESMMNMIRSMTPGMQSTAPKRNLLRIVENDREGGLNAEGMGDIGSTRRLATREGMPRRLRCRAGM